MGRTATRIRVNGIVQGVGFRPFVYRLARALGLVGGITNTGEGVLITVAGDPERIRELREEITTRPPPLARIVSVEAHPAELPDGTDTFSIVESESGRAPTTHVSPDMATCPACLAEILDPADRRHRYPFTNCTDCGPRYTIIRSLPYDRARTTMAAFTMCPRCRAEYEDPADRRFHAQPNACPVCGPSLTWRGGDCVIAGNDPALDAAARAIAEGRIVGVKGLGGFHLAADPFSSEIVTLLRERKNRPRKPFAVMVRDLETARRFCRVPETAARLLTAPEAPIVLLQRREECPLAPELAPGIDELGVMLPSTPLHHLLLQHPHSPACLVMTSGNPGGEPLCRDNDEALARLSPFCDGFLLHDRPIHTRVDDPVIRLISSRPRFLRRARGYAPAPVRLARPLSPLLAVGAELKNCFCLTRGRDAFLSQHIGDLNTTAVLAFFEETLDRLKKMLEIEPIAVAADLHPDYLSSRFAASLGLPLVQVQHHWAHAASVMAEHGLDEALAVILDGTGYGPDATVWGGEVLHCTLHDYRRLGRLSPLPLPGGDAAARQPWRMALAALHAAGIDSPEEYPFAEGVNISAARTILEMIDRGVNSPLTSSCGRLFDAVSSLLGVCHHNTFEGQAAMELEATAARALGSTPLLEAETGLGSGDDPPFAGKGELLEIPTRGLIRTLTATLGRDPEAAPRLAVFFHQFLVRAFGNMIGYLSSRTGTGAVVLSGGSVQNRILTEGFIAFFSRTPFTLYTNEQVPANDGGIALGQAVIGGAHVSGDTHAGR
ncbi:MAG: carbamoyltransferase HypF [Desulfobulbaceae bacterium]